MSKKFIIWFNVVLMAAFVGLAVVYVLTADRRNESSQKLFEARLRSHQFDEIVRDSVVECKGQLSEGEIAKRLERITAILKDKDPQLMFVASGNVAIVNSVVKKAIDTDNYAVESRGFGEGIEQISLMTTWNRLRDTGEWRLSGLAMISNSNGDRSDSVHLCSDQPINKDFSH